MDTPLNRMLVTIWCKRFVAAAVTAATAAAVLGLPLQIVLKIQPAPTWTFLIVFMLSLAFGRLFCECFCPLGVLQTVVNCIFHPKKHARRVCTRLPETRLQHIVRWVVFAAFVALLASGYGAVAWLMTPYSIFSKALLLFLPGLVLCGFVLFLSIFGKGRIWCNWICPVGTGISLLSRVCVVKNIPGPGCENCQACFGDHPDAESDEEDDLIVQNEDDDDEDEDPKPGVTRREALRGVAMLAVADGAFAKVTLPGVPARPATVLPPGAASRKQFNLRCVACGLCVSKCPTGALRPSVSLKSLGQPEMFFQNGFCRSVCNRCAKACPFGALTPIPSSRRKAIHIGLASASRDLCIRKDGVECKACERKCPVGAITIKDGFPVVDPKVCTGCGACEHVCAARPEPAIRVEGLDNQWMDE